MDFFANTRVRPGAAVCAPPFPPATGAKLKFSSVAFYLDMGVKHTTHRRRHGKKVAVTVYLPNATAHQVPVAELSLTGLKSGKHTLKVVISYRETKRRNGTKVTVTVKRSMGAPFTVC